MSIPLLLPLFWWSTASFAADPGPAPTPTPAPVTPAPVPTAPVPASPPAAASGSGERTLASQADIAAYVESVRTGSAGPVLLAAAGPDAEHVALKVAAGMAPGRVRVLRIGYIGAIPEEMRRALESAGMRCGVRIAPTTAGTWLVSTHGECAPPPISAAPGSSVTVAAPAPPASTASPTASIPGLGAALPSVRVEPAPALSSPVPYLAAPPPPPDPEILAATYRLVSLKRVDIPNPRADLPDATWAVRDGRGRTLGALDFARRTGDLASERRVEREGRTARAVGLGLAVGGGALVVAGLGLLVARDAGAPQWSEYEPDGADYTNAEYFEALAQAEADFRTAEESHQIQSDDRVWIAGFLIGAGALSAGTSPMALRGAADRQRFPALYWSQDDADALIGGHNATVRQRIGLPEPVAPTAAVVTPPPDDEGEDAEDLDEEDLDDEPSFDDDPPEDARPAEPPGDEPTLDPAGPSGHRLLPEGDAPATLSVTPYFGVAPPLGSAPAFGVAGLTGTF
ncbi:MAG: hypothetical protein Q8P41_03580 [Pseudomonadota bacterium]|nr:hypothetical protein [Pseudomonadota bacterium]